MIIFICGAPKTFKTTLAKQLQQATKLPLIQTDDHLQLPWDEQLAAIQKQLPTPPASYILEGVAAARFLPRAINKPGLITIHPDLVLWCRGETERLPQYRGMGVWISNYITNYQQTYPERVFIRPE